MRNFDATFEVEGLVFPPKSMYRSIGEWVYYNFKPLLEGFCQKNFVSDFIQLKLTFIPKKEKFAF